MRKPKILYISSVIPNQSCGAHIAIYRHLVFKQDFEVTVCSYNAETSDTRDKFAIPMGRIRKRLQNTRFSKILWNLHYFFNWYFLPKELVKYAKSFDPDIILTVPDNIHSGFAWQLADKLNKPLAIDLQDLFPLSQFIAGYMRPSHLMRKFLMRKFFELHKRADLAFYTSEGMQEYFAPKKNGHVLYPIGDFNRPASNLEHENHDNTNKEDPFTIIYAGNCYGAYGRMLLRFARLVKDNPDIHLKIYPVGKGWSDHDINIMTKAGIYKSFTPFEKLKLEFQKADAFLTVMSFEEPEKPFVSTSFTTKWLDYAPYGKPIFSWAPEYSSANIFSRKYNCGVITETDDENALMESCISLKNDSALKEYYGKNAKEVSDTILNPDNIHSVLVNEIYNLVNGKE